MGPTTGNETTAVSLQRPGVVPPSASPDLREKHKKKQRRKSETERPKLFVNLTVASLPSCSPRIASASPAKMAYWLSSTMSNSTLLELVASGHLSEHTDAREWILPGTEPTP